MDGGPCSVVDVAGLGAVEGVAAGDPPPVGGLTAIAVTTELDDRGDESPDDESEECEEKDHGRNATVGLDPPRVAE
jgi:hypothetical protein